LEEGGNLCSRLDSKFKVYPDILETAGYRMGFKSKGWGPGTLEGTGRTRNPAGNEDGDFDAFLRSTPHDQPFCYWWGTSDPHRDYDKGSGLASGMDIDKVRVPEFLPDHPNVRSDILDYYFEIERYDREFGQVLEQLEHSGRAENTIVVMTSDNGMPFPRAKTTLYDYGTRMPLAIRWPAQVPGGRVVDDFVNLVDMAPTFIEACGLEPLPEMSGKSLLNILRSEADGRVDPSRKNVITGRERHSAGRPNLLGYPSRAIRNYDHLYIWNLESDRLPGGLPDFPEYKLIPQYGDIDSSPTKDYMMTTANTPEGKRLFDLAVAKRPEEELYDVRKDPYQMKNIAADPTCRSIKEQMRNDLENKMRALGDPRGHGSDGGWDQQDYFGWR